MKTGAGARERDIRRNVVCGMALNLALVCVKWLAGWFGGSRALMMDAVHSLTDFATDAMLLVGSRYWSTPPDEEHPYGHRRIETVIAVVVGIVLCVTGIALAYPALRALSRYALGQGAPMAAPGWLAFAVAAASIVSKEWLYRWTMRTGRRLHSVALQANAWHHRSDALSSIPVATVIVIALFWPSLAFLDSVGAVVVAVFLAQAAYKIIRPSLNELLELGAPKALQRDIEALAMEIPGVRSVHAIRSRYAGAALFIDLHIQVHPKTTVEDGHAISSKVCSVIHCHTANVLDVLIHVEPYKAASRPSRPADDKRQTTTEK